MSGSFYFLHFSVSSTHLYGNFWPLSSAHGAFAIITVNSQELADSFNAVSLLEDKKLLESIKNKEVVPTYLIYSDNDALLIGKNGKNLKALSVVVNQHINTELGKTFKFIIDINSYKEKHEKQLEQLAKRIAREVASTKIEVKMDSMNSYERRIVHNALTNNKYVYTESTGTEPNRYVVIKPKEEVK